MDTKTEEVTHALFETDYEVSNVVTNDQLHSKKILQSDGSYKHQIVWRNLFLMTLVHVFGIWGMLILPQINTSTLIFLYSLLMLGTLGVQSGAHRLWSHRTYKANFGLRLFLSLCHVLALQNDIYEWGKTSLPES